MNEIKLTNIDTKIFNPFGATAEELVANLINESGLMRKDTRINGIPAKEYCDSFYEKRASYKESTRIGSFLVRNDIISQNQLDEALVRQKQNRDLRLGQILVNMNVCSKDEIHHSLNEQTTMRAGID